MRKKFRFLTVLVVCVMVLSCFSVTAFAYANEAGIYSEKDLGPLADYIDYERYYNIAAKCDKETMLQREYTPDCMDKRNRYMVDHADYILAVWNGCPSGTGNTVRYAHKKGKSIIVINPVSLDVTRE